MLSQTNAKQFENKFLDQVGVFQQCPLTITLSKKLHEEILSAEEGRKSNIRHSGRKIYVKYFILNNRHFIRQIPEKKEIDDNDEHAIDEETYEARKWDEFKDANPRGWGKFN